MIELKILTDFFRVSCTFREKYNITYDLFIINGFKIA